MQMNNQNNNTSSQPYTRVTEESSSHRVDTSEEPTITEESQFKFNDNSQLDRLKNRQ